MSKDVKKMIEWYNSYKKLSSKFWKLPQERLDKVNPRRKLTAEEEKRLSKLEAIAVKLKLRENVQTRQLQTQLSEYAQIEVFEKGSLNQVI